MHRAREIILGIPYLRAGWEQTCTVMSAIFITAYSKHLLCSSIFRTKGLKVSRPVLRKDISQILWKPARVQWELLSGSVFAHIPEHFAVKLIPTVERCWWMEASHIPQISQPFDHYFIKILWNSYIIHQESNGEGPVPGTCARLWKCWVFWVGKSILIQVLGIPEYRSIFPLTCSFKAVPLHKSSY